MDTVYSGHYITHMKSCDETFYCNDNQVTEYEIIDIKLTNCICCDFKTDHMMMFGQEQDGLKFIHAHGAGTSSTPHLKQVTSVH